MPDQIHRQIEDLSVRLDAKHAENIERLIRIESGYIHLDECLDDLKKKLFGNGQPGVLSVLDNRISILEKWMWRATGMISLIIVALRILGK